MFIRVKSTPNSPRKSVQIVESTRNNGKVSQKIVRHVGIALDESEEQKLRDLALEIISKIQKERIHSSCQLSLLDQPSEQEIQDYIAKKPGRPKRKNIEDILPTSQVTLDDLVEKTRIVEGVHEIAGTVYDDLYANVIKGKRQAAILKDLVMARLVAPCSKFKSQKILLKQFNIDHDLDAIYRVMDKVYDNIDMIKQLTFNNTKNLFPDGIDVLLFDVTTLYFESVTTDELRKFGYSKDHRFNTTQLILALATNSEGLPVGYELFEGNKAEVSTLIEAIESWEKIFSVGKVCFVGDRAMMSKDNVKLLESKGYDYIIAMKLRSISSELKTCVFNEKNYNLTAMGDDLGWIGEFDYTEKKPRTNDLSQNITDESKGSVKRLIVSYKSSRAKKDAKDREQIVDKIRKRLSGDADTKKLISNSGVKKYTTITDSAAKLDDEKIAKDAEWDGFHGVLTNLDDSHEAISILSRYSSLWRIEESFRINKHTLKMRPIFHWKPERIKAHISICYMTFSVLRNMEYKASLRQKVTVNNLIEELLHVQSSIYIHKKTKDLYRMPGAFSNTARKIYKAFDIERPLDASIYLP